MSKKDDKKSVKSTTEPREQNVPASEIESSDSMSENERAKMFTRRALIQAGWVMPIVEAIPLPAHAETTHIDSAHADSVHNDGPYVDHGDAPHGDQHIDEGGLVSHADFTVHDDSHGDETIGSGSHIDFIALHSDIHLDDHGDSHVDQCLYSTGDPTSGSHLDSHTDDCGALTCEALLDSPHYTHGDHNDGPRYVYNSASCQSAPDGHGDIFIPNMGHSDITPHIDSHNDFYNYGPHLDTHSDSHGDLHSDLPENHNDTTAGGSTHLDAHGDGASVHADQTHGDLHGDVAHSDGF